MSGAFIHKSILPLLDWFIPPSIRETDSDQLMTRTFVLLHLLGPIMGHSVTFFLWQASPDADWQFWAIEAIVVSFLAIPLLLRVHGSLKLPAMVSVQVLVGLSLFGSFFFGGISSPLLPWFLIAMVLGFFYLADAIGLTLAGVAAQLACFVGARVAFGDFPDLLQTDSLKLANTFSILTALAYMTTLCLYYETVMRISLRLEQETIEQRSRIELLREAMQTAERASTQKSIFLAKMSHELRTPLNAVIGYAEMLRENLADRPNARRKMQDLDRIHAAGRHLLALVTDVIDLSSIEANRIELSTQPVVISSLVDEVVATASPLISKRDNRLMVSIAEDLGTLELDALKVRQSLLNLLSNAAKFTAKGMIMLSVFKRPDGDRERLLLEVTDNGIGIAPDALQRIFQTFAQAENDTVTRFGGTGLGLALTKRFCQMMGGDITVRSERGAGTSFTIDLPLVRVAAADIPANQRAA